LRLFCFYISRQTQYLRGLRGFDAPQSQYLSHLRRNTRPPENRQNWRFVGVFSNNSPTKIQQDFEAYFRAVFLAFSAFAGEHIFDSRPEGWFKRGDSLQVDFGDRLFNLRAFGFYRSLIRRIAVLRDCVCKQGLQFFVL